MKVSLLAEHARQGIASATASTSAAYEFIHLAASRSFLCFAIGFLGAALGLGAVLLLRKYCAKEEDAGGDACSPAPSGEAAVEVEGLTSTEYEELAVKVAQRLAQRFGPSLAKGQAVRSILQTQMDALPNKAKHFVLTELNAICGNLFEAVDAEEAMLLLEWDEVAQMAMPSPSMLLAGLLSPAMLAAMYYVDLVQIFFAQAPICGICVWAIVKDWHKDCRGIPMLKAWVAVEAMVASVLIISRAMLVWRISKGRQEMKDNQLEMEEKMGFGPRVDPAEVDLRDTIVHYTVLLKKGLLIEVGIRGSFWHQLSGVGTVFWILMALWNYVLVFGWTFIPGAVAFHPAAEDIVPREFCGAWASVVASRLTSLLSLLFLILDALALAGFSSDRLCNYPFMAKLVSDRATEFDKHYMQGLPVAQTFAKAFVLRGATEESKAKLAVSVYERKQLMKRRLDVQRELERLEAQIGKLEAQEKSLTEKAALSERSDLAAEAQRLEQGLLDADAWKSRGKKLSKEAAEKAAQVEQSTTDDIERMVNRVLEAINMGMETETYQMVRSSVVYTAEVGMERATDAAQAAAEKVKEVSVEEAAESAKAYMGTVKSEAQAYMGAAKSEAQAYMEAAKTYSEAGMRLVRGGSTSQEGDEQETAQPEEGGSAAAVAAPAAAAASASPAEEAKPPSASSGSAGS